MKGHIGKNATRLRALVQIF